MAVGVWNLLVFQAWSGLGATRAGADLGGQLSGLAVFGAWIALDRRRTDFGVGRPSNYRAAWYIAPLVGMVFALNFEQAAFVQLAPALLPGAVLAACWEELAFRGVLMGRLMRYGAKPAAWISSIGFGLLHAVQPDPLAAALSVFMSAGLGLSLAALRLGTGSLWPALAAHLLINLSASATLGAHPAAQSGQIWVPLLLGTFFLAYGAFLLSLIRPQATRETDG